MSILNDNFTKKSFILCGIEAPSVLTARPCLYGFVNTPVLHYMAPTCNTNGLTDGLLSLMITHYYTCSALWGTIYLHQHDKATNQLKPLFNMAQQFLSSS